jgi:hypothetical protein
MAMEIVSREHPDLLIGAIPRLVELAAKERVPQVRWHVAEVFGNVPVSDQDAERIIPILLEYLSDSSKIVKYCAVQTLGTLGTGSSRRKDIAGAIRPARNESKSLAEAVDRALQNLSTE